MESYSEPLKDIYKSYGNIISGIDYTINKTIDDVITFYKIMYSESKYYSNNLNHFTFSIRLHSVLIFYYICYELFYSEIVKNVFNYLFNTISGFITILSWQNTVLYTTLSGMYYYRTNLIIMDELYYTIKIDLIKINNVNFLITKELFTTLLGCIFIIYPIILTYFFRENINVFSIFLSFIPLPTYGLHITNFESIFFDYNRLYPLKVPLKEYETNISFCITMMYTMLFFHILEQRVPSVICNI